MIRRAVGLVVGALAIIVLLRFVPDDVFRVTATVLYLCAAAILFLVSLALFLAPAQRLLSSLFALGLRVPDGAIFAGVPEPQLRRTLSPLVVAAVCAGVAALGSLLR